MVLTGIKEQFVFSIKVFKSNQNIKERCNQGNITITESHLKTSDSSLKTYQKVPGCMSHRLMKPSREDKKDFCFSLQFHVFIFKKGKSWNTIDFMGSLHSLEVHDSVPGPTQKLLFYRWGPDWRKDKIFFYICKIIDPSLTFSVS